MKSIKEEFKKLKKMTMKERVKDLRKKWFNSLADILENK